MQLDLIVALLMIVQNDILPPSRNLPSIKALTPNSSGPTPINRTLFAARNGLNKKIKILHNYNENILNKVKFMFFINIHVVMIYLDS